MIWPFGSSFCQWDVSNFFPPNRVELDLVQKNTSNRTLELQHTISGKCHLVQDFRVKLEHCSPAAARLCAPASAVVMLCTRLLSPIVLSVISEGLPISTSLLEAISQDRPDSAVFPSPPEPHHVPPFRTEIAGAKQTNKFWSNWAVEEWLKAVDTLF